VEKFRVGIEKGNPEGFVCKRQQIGVRAKLHSAPKEPLELAKIRVAIVTEAHGGWGNISAVRARSAVLKHPRMNSVFCLAAYLCGCRSI
jgi:hypothetical protein